MIYKIEFKEQANKDLVALARYEPKAFLKLPKNTDSFMKSETLRWLCLS